MHYPEEFPCYKLKLNDLPRRRLDECFTEHPDVRCFFIDDLHVLYFLMCIPYLQEADVTYCGTGNGLAGSTIFTFIVCFLVNISF